MTPKLSVDGGTPQIQTPGAMGELSRVLAKRQADFEAAQKKAQEKIMGITARLERIADAMETRSKAKTFQFNVAFNKEFAME
jgi:hypothetical protein